MCIKLVILEIGVPLKIIEPKSKGSVLFEVAYEIEIARCRKLRNTRFPSSIFATLFPFGVKNIALN